MSRLLGIGIVAVLVIVGVFTWAGQQRPPDRYLDAIKARGTLRVGLDPSYPPFESRRDGQYAGYDIDLAKAIANDLGMHVEFKPLALDTQYDALASDQVDMLISALPFVYERQKEVRYSQPYYQAGQVIVVRRGDTSVKAVSDLQGKTVGVELGSNADTEARRLARSEPLAATVSGVELSPGPAVDRAALPAWVRGAASTFHHPVGTCAMGPDPAAGAVTDSHGSVHGVDGLTVADASIMPTIPNATTNLPTMMVAEHIARWLIG